MFERSTISRTTYRVYIYILNRVCIIVLHLIWVGGYDFLILYFITIWQLPLSYGWTE